MKKIPFLDLTAQYRSIKKELDQAIFSVIKGSAFVGGSYVEKFEKEFANYCQTKFAVSVNSGTDALLLSLKALGISKGDEVIVPSFSFFATAEVIANLEAIPVFIDIDPKTLNINPDLIEKKITSKTKAILPVHLFGRPASMNQINKLAKRHKFHVVEDACQAVGTTYDGQKIGSLGITGCFSFFPSKNLGAFGDGGMVTTNDPQIAQKIRKLRSHGSLVKYQNEEIGVNSRLDGLQASILSAKLKHLDSWNKTRHAIAQRYNALLSNISHVETPSSSDKPTDHIFHQYTIRLKSGFRDKLKNFLASRGIPTMIYYPIPIHLLKAMDYLGYKKGTLPETELACQEVLSLPIYPELAVKEINYISQSICQFFQSA